MAADIINGSKFNDGKSGIGKPKNIAINDNNRIPPTVNTLLYFITSPLVNKLSSLTQFINLLLILAGIACYCKLLFETHGI